MVEGLIFVLHIFGFLGILIVLTYMAPHARPSDVFDMFLNEGGWHTQGLSFMIGLSGMAYAFVGASSLALSLRSIHKITSQDANTSR